MEHRFLIHTKKFGPIRQKLRQFYSFEAIVISKKLELRNDVLGSFWGFYGPQIHILLSFGLYFSRYMQSTISFHKNLVWSKNIEIWPF